jgi:hypothetical protein
MRTNFDIYIFIYEYDVVFFVCLWSTHIVLCFCFVFFIYVASVSGFSNFDCPFGFSNVYFRIINIQNDFLVA